MFNVESRSVLGLHWSNSREPCFAEIGRCKGEQNFNSLLTYQWELPLHTKPEFTKCLWWELSLMLESDVISVNCSSSEELRSSGAGAVNGSLTQSNCTLFSGKYFWKWPLRAEMCSKKHGITVLSVSLLVLEKVVRFSKDCISLLEFPAPHLQFSDEWTDLVCQMW